MRIVAGEWGGRRLRAPRGRATRPTAERVREALFSVLGDIEGLAVLDLFAGSGALGLEALSRGARHAVFVEHDRRALDALRANADALMGAGRLERADIRGGDVLKELGLAGRRGESYDLVFADPPYGESTRLAGPLSDGLEGVVVPLGRVVCESDRRAPLELGLTQADRRSYGDTVITIYRTSAKTT